MHQATFNPRGKEPDTHCHTKFPLSEWHLGSSPPNSNNKTHSGITSLEMSFARDSQVSTEGWQSSHIAGVGPQKWENIEGRLPPGSY